jgi:hypothetical protein
MSRTYILSAETRSLLLVTAVWFVCNSLTLNAWPRVWVDEVQDTDVAANVFFTGDFVTRVHPYQDPGTFFSGNPLYPLILGGWFHLWGFGLLPSRAFDLAVALGTAVLLWIGSRRLGVLTLPTTRVGVFAVVLFADEFVRVYRGHRYDLAGILALSGLYAAMSIRQPVARWVTIGVCGALIPLAAFGPVILSVPCAVLLLCWRGHKVLPDLVAAGVGVVLGLATYAGILQYNGVLDDMLNFMGREDVVHRMGFRGVLYAPSSVILALASACLPFVVRLRRKEKLASLVRSPLLALVAWVFLVPLWVGFCGRYHYWYAWMACLPALVMAGMAWERYGGMSVWARRAAVGVACLVILQGLPYRTALACLEWREMDYSQIEDYVSGIVKPGDQVLCDAAPYYPVKRICPNMFSRFALHRLTQKDKESITVILASVADDDGKPGWAQRTMLEAGGVWHRLPSLEIPRSELRRKLSVSTKEPWVYNITAFRKELP